MNKRYCQNEGSGYCGECVSGDLRDKISDLKNEVKKAHAAGLAEGEAKRAFLVNLIRQVSEFKDIDWDNDSVLAHEAETYQKHLLKEAHLRNYIRRNMSPLWLFEHQ